MEEKIGIQVQDIASLIEVPNTEVIEDQEVIHITPSPTTEQLQKAAGSVHNQAKQRMQSVRDMFNNIDEQVLLSKLGGDIWFYVIIYDIMIP